MEAVIAIYCDFCQQDMHRVPQSSAVNWGGPSPSEGGINPEVRRHVDNVDKFRDGYREQKEKVHRD